MNKPEQDPEFIERAAAAVHEAYLATCDRLGWKVKPSNRVPYCLLSNDAKELDRASVRAVLSLLPVHVVNDWISFPDRWPPPGRFVQVAMLNGQEGVCKLIWQEGNEEPGSAGYTWMDGDGCIYDDELSNPIAFWKPLMQAPKANR